MKTTALLLALLLPLLGGSLHAQLQHITTDKAPSALFVDRDNRHIHLLTAGVDNNGDGIFQPDSGDALPWWFVIDSQSDAVVDSVMFDGLFNSFPIRVGVDTASGILYVPQSGRVRSYDLNTRRLLRDTVVPGNYSGISFEPVSKLIICHMRPGFTTPGYVVAIAPGTGDTLGIYPAGVNPQMSVSALASDTRGPAVYTLNEGSFGQGNSSISYASGNNDIFAAVNGTALGGGASFIATHGDTAYVVLNGTHQIRVIDTKTHLELPPSPFAVGTSGFNGPRSLAFQGSDTLLVPTYAGDLRRFDVKGVMIDSILLPGKGESIAVRDSLAFVAIKYGLGGSGYDADSLVAVVNLRSRRVIDTIDVGLDPGTLFFDRRGDLHVIGYGAGDTAHWWMSFDGTTFAKKGERRLRGALGFPLHVAYDPVRDSLYLSLSDSIFAFSAAGIDAPSRLLYTDPTASGNLTGVTLSGEDLLVNEVPRNFSPDAGYVHIVHRSDGHRIAKFRAGSFLTMTVPVASARKRATSFYALNEGSFGSPSSTITLFQYAPNIFGGDSLGKGANHIIFGGEQGIVTMNGDHSVALVSFKDWYVMRRYPVGTSGFDGPRESAVMNDDYLLVTTYAGDVRSMKTNGDYRVVPTGGKAEGIVVLGSKAYIANVAAPDYSPDSTVVVIDAAVLSVTRVETVSTESAALEQNIPNPVADRTTIRFSVQEPGEVQLALYSLDGKLVKTLLDRRMEAGSYSVELGTDALPAGTYIYTLRCGAMLRSRTMQVVR
jgi:hypothetical protein